MSEIKGQLLGIILVIAVFGVVATALTAAFKTTTENVGKKMEESPSTSITESSDDKEEDSGTTGTNSKLLVF